MAKTKERFQVRTVKTKEDRKRPSVFMSLKEDEAFKAVALFEPNPELKNNPGYFEYFSHWDQEGNTYVPCAGEKCPFCAANDNPNTQALTVWYFPQAAEKKDQIKVFTMNYSTTQDASDESEDESGLLGKVVRIKRLNKKGDYRVKVTSDKPLSKSELKKVMAMVEEKFPDGLSVLVLNQLKRQMERLKALEVMDDDDDEDEDEDEEQTARKGKKASDEEDEDEDEDEESEDEDEDEDEDESSAEGESFSDETFEILSVRKKDGYLVVEKDDDEIKLYASDDAAIDDFKKGQSITVSADWTEEEDEEPYYLLTEIAEASEEEEEEAEEEEEDEDESESDTEIDGQAYTVIKTQEKDEIIEAKDDDGEKVKFWVGDGVDVDFDEVKKGVNITVSAEKDEEDDWIITELDVVKSGKKGAKKK